MKNDWKFEALKILVGVANDVFPKNWRPNIGLCNNVRWELEDRGIHYNDLYQFRYWIKEQFPHWPHYSGDLGFPVPSMDKDVRTMDAYYHSGDLYVGEYGDMRKNLAGFLARRLKDESVDLARASVRACIIMGLEKADAGNYPETWDKSEGICYNMSCLMTFNDHFAVRHEIRQEMKRIFKAWPEFSGDVTWPICNGDVDPKKSYLFAKDKWTNSKYGKARKRLLKFLIEKLKSEEYRLDTKELDVSNSTADNR